MFSFVAERYLSYEAPADLTFDHAFECAGGEGSTSAIDFVIEHIQPQGTLMLMGVSEHPVPVFTRNARKGHDARWCSRSGRDDFLAAIDVMRDKDIQRRLSQIVHFDGEVNDIKTSSGYLRPTCKTRSKRYLSGACNGLDAEGEAPRGLDPRRRAVFCK